MSLATSLIEHWDVFRAALALDRKHAANRPRYTETEFLPAALEVMESPPSPMARSLLWAMILLVVAALLWSIFGTVDVVAVGSGKVVPADRVKIIQWGGTGGSSEGLTGVIRAIHVRDGQSVRKGELLLELDPTVTSADEAQAQRGLMSAEIERARAKAIARYLSGGAATFVMQGAPADVVATQRSLIASTLAEYEARRASLAEQRAAAEARLAAARDELAKLNETLPLLEKQAAARKELADKGYGSKLQLWQLQEAVVERSKNVIIQKSAIAEARAVIANLNTQLSQLRQELAKGSYTDLAKAEDDASIRHQEIAKAVQRRQLTRITAPVDGIVSQLAISTIGGAVQAAQPLMAIVPQRSQLIVEAQIANKDVGFLRIGQAVHVKLEAFPFTTYGIVDGRLTSLSADAQPADGTLATETQRAEKAHGPGAANGGLMFDAKIAMSQQSISALLQKAGCAAVAPCLRHVTPGMTAQVEIKTGERRIIDYILSPLARTAHEAGRER